MKILISPSKTQDFSKPLGIGNDKLKYTKVSNKIHKYLKTLSTSEIISAYNISENLASEVQLMIKNYKKSSSSEAISAYTGSVYREIKLDTYQDEELLFMQEHIRILSSFYGVLRPFDLIKPYRLDMKTKLSEINIRKIWTDYYTKEFKDEDLIVNLASKEFSSLINMKFVNLEFKDCVSDKYLVKGTYAKTARGKMVNEIIKNRYEKIEDIKKIVVDNYKYNEDLSDGYNLIFTRE